ncbi:hypothetical protein [Aliiroseovarius sediminis]|uniref:hypothetical protein n=1 Tax=Aliiroseovarius sediminis TaxID=2925839 RepID=UPI001F55AF87|nr:hypothetical protein [Aliiroseovarius sediminis]MCI2394451.1 hypothetical protein [Aliiroseovarius sediminis]
MTLSKFDVRAPELSSRDPDCFEPFSFPDVWQLEEHESFSRLRIGPSGRQIGLMLDICKRWETPLWMLVVVVVSRDEWAEGRYQSPHPVSFSELELLLWEYQELFEQDGRAHMWIGSSETKNLLVMDRHNLIYAYGDLASIENTVVANALSEGDVSIPYPHSHHYHVEFDSTFRALMEHWDWRYSELQPGDDD